VIWGNQLRHGEYKYIGAFPHFVRCRCPASGTSRFNRLLLLRCTSFAGDADSGSELARHNHPQQSIVIHPYWDSKAATNQEAAK
jgi:hypothetical protein